jgi:hypothetical protein
MSYPMGKQKREALKTLIKFNGFGYLFLRLNSGSTGNQLLPIFFAPKAHKKHTKSTQNAAPAFSIITWSKYPHIVPHNSRRIP